MPCRDHNLKRSFNICRHNLNLVTFSFIQINLVHVITEPGCDAIHDASDMRVKRHSTGGTHIGISCNILATEIFLIEGERHLQLHPTIILQDRNRRNQHRPALTNDIGINTILIHHNLVVSFTLSIDRGILNFTTNW